jgi:hypothetical protein
MAVIVDSPTPSRRSPSNCERVQVAAQDVGVALNELEMADAGLKPFAR